MAAVALQPERFLPAGGLGSGTFVGRAWVPGDEPGPSPVLVTADGVYELAPAVATLSHLLIAPHPVATAVASAGRRLGSAEELLANAAHDRLDPARPHFLAPADLAALKACGVTFVRSMLERVIEDRAKGDPDRAQEIRAAIGSEIGASLRDIQPGSAAAMKVKQVLQARDLWSPYLEVGIGPDAEVFTKAQPMSAVGSGAEIGIRPESTWNNPEPEVVLAIAPDGTIIGATLGNDVNLRDVEGRSALLLGKAKDNRATCAIGPFIRLVDTTWGLDDIRGATVGLTVEGEDGFRLEGRSQMAEISRDITDLAGQALGPSNQFPDGLLLFTGTMFAPTEDRDAPGRGFTHHLGDVVTIASEALGGLTNRVNHTDRIAPWTQGTAWLMRNLARRGLL